MRRDGVRKRWRSWFRRYRAGLAFTGAIVVAVTAFALLLWRGAGWLDGAGLRGLSPDRREAAVDAVRGRLIQLGAGLVAVGALAYTARNFRLSREGHVTDRYTKAIEQLGSERLDVRLGAIYALERIMIDSRRDHPTIVEVLAAYIREHSPNVGVTADQGDRQPDPDGDVRTSPAARPATDVQAALTVLGRRPSGREERGSLDLRAVNLAGADLDRAYLDGVNLNDTNLARAYLTGAHLTGAYLVFSATEGGYGVRLSRR